MTFKTQLKIELLLQNNGSKKMLGKSPVDLVCGMREDLLEFDNEFTLEMSSCKSIINTKLEDIFHRVSSSRQNLLTNISKGAPANSC